MRCRVCGTQNKDNAKFCKKCGNALIQNTPPQMNQVSNNSSSSRAKKIIIIFITVLICAGLIGGTLAFIHFNKNNNNANTPNVNNSTNTSEEPVVNNTTNSEDNNTNSTNQSTINSDVYSYNVQGVSFNVPSSGHMRTSEALSFTFNGETCEVQKVPQYEASTYNHELSSITFSKNYQNGEPYKLIVNNHPWIGVKVNKDGQWFHISMNINDVNEAEKLVDWMSQHNTWNAP